MGTGLRDAAAHRILPKKRAGTIWSIRIHLTHSFREHTHTRVVTHRIHKSCEVQRYHTSVVRDVNNCHDCEPTFVRELALLNRGPGPLIFVCLACCPTHRNGCVSDHHPTLVASACVCARLWAFDAPLGDKPAGMHARDHDRVGMCHHHSCDGGGSRNQVLVCSSVTYKGKLLRTPVIARVGAVSTAAFSIHDCARTVDGDARSFARSDTLSERVSDRER